DADLLVISAAGDPFAEPLAGVFAEVACDVAVLVERGGPVADGPIVVPFGAFEHDWVALELGARVAGSLGRPLRLVGALGIASDPGDAGGVLGAGSPIAREPAGIVAEPYLGPPGRAGIAEAAAGAGLLVLGLSERWRTEGLGETRAGIAAEPPAPTVLIRRGL